jgi:hypothetical protein
MPALRLLTLWPWGCPKTLNEVPDGNFRFRPNENNYWLRGSLSRVMRWYYQVKTWRIVGQPFLGTGDTPAASELSGEFSFSNPADVVCGREGLKLQVGGDPVGLDFFLFLPTPPDFQASPVLTRPFSAVQVDDTTYAPFCYIEGRFRIGPTGFLGFQTNLESSRAWLDLTFDGREIFKRTTSQFDLSWKVTVTPVEFFDFSD